MVSISLCGATGLLLYLISAVSGQQGVCYVRSSRIESVVLYISTSYVSSYTCGLWNTCYRRRYRMSSAPSLGTIYYSTFGCCTGYTRNGSRCDPVCTGNCNDRGTCVSPNVCSCMAGWSSNGCATDINECSSSNTNNCQAICINTVGSYICSCNPGYRLNPDRRTCAEIHECNEMTDNCEHNCHNSDGSFYCTCRSGYTLSSNGYSCINVDECTTGTAQCSQLCHDYPGTYNCSCHRGYSLQADGISCADINECAASSSPCSQLCINTLGSYRCGCRAGYELADDGITCTDINECANQASSLCSQICTNSAGSYVCSCRPGYILDSDGQRCNDVDECRGSHGCSNFCSNTVGSYMCSCPPGYTLGSDGRSCNSIPICSEVTTCHQTCVETSSTYTCSCRTGFTLNSDGISCDDLNECAAGLHRCEEICINTLGSYTCQCSQGHALGTDMATCLGPPQLLSFSQVESRRSLLSWSPPIEGSSDGLLRSYLITCSSQEDRNFILMVSTTALQTKYQLQNQQPFTTYNCCVSAQTSLGNGPYLCSIQRMAEDVPSTSPELTSITSGDPHSVSFRVSPPARPNGLIIAYTFYISFDNESSVIAVDRSGAGGLTIGGISPYQLVAVQVSANSSAGEGPRSDLDEIRTQQSVPSEVAQVVVQVISRASISVSWDPPIRPNGILLNYTVRVYNRRSVFAEATNVESSDRRRRIEVEGLRPYVPYTVEVSARTVMGEGPAVAHVVFTEHGVPNIPTLTNVIRTHSDRARVLWIPLTPDEARGALTNLQIVYALSTNSSCSYVSVHEGNVMLMNINEEIDTQSEAVIEGLLASEQYCVSIQVRTSAGESGFSQFQLLSLPSDLYIQVRMTLPGDTSCQDYLSNNRQQEASDISSAIVEEVLRSCNCPYSLDYMANSTLLCGTNEKEVIYQSNMLNTGSTPASYLKLLLQNWVDTSPSVLVGGELQVVQSYCQVDLSELGNTEECNALNPTTDSSVEEGNGDKGSLNIAVIAGGAAGGVVFILLLVFISAGVVAYCFRRSTPSKQKDNFNIEDENFYDDHIPAQVLRNAAYGVKPTTNDGTRVPSDYEASVKVKLQGDSSFLEEDESLMTSSADSPEWYEDMADNSDNKNHIDEGSTQKETEEFCDKSKVALGESNVASDAQAQRNTTVAMDDAKKVQQREPKAPGKYLVPDYEEHPQPSEISPIYEDIDKFYSSKQTTEQSGWKRGKNDKGKQAEKMDRHSKDHKKKLKLRQTGDDSRTMLINSKHKSQDEQKRIFDGNCLKVSEEDQNNDEEDIYETMI